MGIVLKDWYGSEKIYDHDKIFFRDENGELVQFTKGTGEEETNENLLYYQAFEGFTLNDGFGGLYTADCPSELADFEIVVGQEYVVVWDDEYYSVIAEDASAILPGALSLGNGSALGLNGNGEPFAIGYTSSGVTFVSYDTTETHSVGIIKRVRHQDLLLQDIEITENGEYYPNSAFDGFSKVIVDVKLGGGMLPSGAYWGLFEDIPEPPKQYNHNWFELGGELYSFLGANSATSNTIWAKYKMVNGEWVELEDKTSVDCDRFSICPIELNGKLHFLPKYGSYHWTFDGVTAVKLNNFPITMDYSDQVFLQDGKLKCYAKKIVYVWDESTDTWTQEATLSLTNSSAGIFNVDGIIYMSADSKMYVYENKTITKYADLSTTIYCNCGVVVNRKLYYGITGGATTSDGGMLLYCYDFATKTNALLTKVPSYGNHCHLKAWCNKLLVLPDERYTYASIFQLHEVTE